MGIVTMTQADGTAVNADSLQAGLDLLPDGVGIFDSDLKLIAHNRHFASLRDYPPELCSLGTSLESLLAYNAARGDYGDVDRDGEIKEPLLEPPGRRTTSW